MKLATRDTGGDGTLLVVSRDLARAVDARAATSLRQAIEHWREVEPALAAEHRALEAGEATNAFPLDLRTLAAPLPRAWQFLDGSAFLAHNRILARAGGYAPRTPADPPLMYQGLSDRFLPAHAPVAFRSVQDDIDLEAEFAVLVDAVPLGTPAAAALAHVKLVMLLNDWSLRAFGRAEVKAGFGFLHAKPPCSLAPVAVTPDELGAAWAGGRVHLVASIARSGRRFGAPHGGEMSYGFDELIAHAALTRDLCAGTLIGSGTISNDDTEAVGSGCIAERRALDVLAGRPPTPFLDWGERVRIEVKDAEGRSIFGAMDQEVVAR